MSNYSIHKNEQTKKYNVVGDSDRVIEVFDVYDDARKFIRSMKMGVGFIDWTPEFIKVRVR